MALPDLLHGCSNNDLSGATLSLYLHRPSWKNMPDHGGNRTYDLWNISTPRRSGTHVKISQLVASLQTSRQQVVFARLVTSCQQVWNKLLTTCNNLVNIVRLVTRFQQGCYNHDITILLQPCVVNLVTFLLYHVCIRLVRTTL